MKVILENMKYDLEKIQENLLIAKNNDNIGYKCFRIYHMLLLTLINKIDLHIKRFE